MISTPRLPQLLLGLLFLAPGATAGTIYVDANLNTGANDGSTWADAYQGSGGLQTALAAAVANDQIFAAQGTYLPSGTGTRTDAFVLQNNVEIYGGFLGTETSPGERPAFGTAPSILLGDLAGNDGSGIFTDNSYHLVTGGGTNASAVLDGFRILSGAANGAGNNNKGAGILCIGGSSPTVRNCEFVANRCTFGGGAGYINGSAPTFTDCTFDGNIGGSFGGAFDIANSGAVKYDRCVFKNNSAARAGALEVFATNGVQVTNSVFCNNTATGASGGGAIWLGSGGTTAIANCTVVANSSTVQASAGLRVQGATAQVASSIFWDNTGPGGAQGSANQISAGATVVYSTVEGGYAGAGNLSVDPQFVNLGAKDFTLTVSSPGVDAGNNNAVPAGITLDLARNPRFVDEPTVADTGLGVAPIVDMGAYEWQGAPGFTVYCTAGTSAAGCQASIGATGTPSATAASGFSLTASGVEGNKSGLFYFGTNGQQANSWGNGTSFQCVTPPVVRTTLQNGGGTNGLCDGAFAVDLNALWCPTCPKPAKNPGSGATVQAQLWYRDPMNTSNQTTSLSNGVEFFVGP